MKSITSLFAVISIASSCNAQEAKLIGIDSTSGLPKDAEFGVRPSGYYGGIRLSFMIEGKNLIGFDEKSLKADGWEMRLFPKVSKNGDLATFSISKKGDFLGKENEVKMNGTIALYSSMGSKKAQAVLPVEGNKEMGPFKASLKISAKSKWKNGVHLEGNFSLLKKISIMKDGKEEESRSWGGFGDTRTYQFKEVDEKSEIVLEYWTDAKKVTFNIKK